MFNSTYTFKSFVTADSNIFSYAAAKAVAEAPGKSYNPLFIYGSVSFGKTHLLHAIGQHVLRKKRVVRVAYLTAEQFTSEYVDAIQKNKLVAFRKNYRQTDLLLIDDIQHLGGKVRMQEELFHTFNFLHEAHSQIVIAGNCSPSEIQGLEKRLVSRFEWGLVVELHQPDTETRLAILRNKQLASIKIPDDILHFLADRIRTDIRRLEGAMMHVASYATLTGKKLTIKLVENILWKILQEERKVA